MPEAHPPPSSPIASLGLARSGSNASRVGKARLRQRDRWPTRRSVVVRLTNKAG
jgi:hypothetical protein